MLVVGGAGFIGSHVCERLLKEPGVKHVIALDNLSVGTEWRVAHLDEDARFTFVAADVLDGLLLPTVIEGCDTVIHLAANADIAKASEDPTVDFRHGTVLTQAVLEAARKAGVDHFVYASGSGVYREGEWATEYETPLEPRSPYGASKLAGEALIHSYCSMFGMRGAILRFANVVGARQTHGVVYDFLRKLHRDPANLFVLGDGQQSKSYVHVVEAVGAMLLASRRATSARMCVTYNVATEDSISVMAIAKLVAPKAELHFGTGARGWRGDVPLVRMASSRIRALGWRNKLDSKQAIERSLVELRQDLELHREGCQ